MQGRIAAPNKKGKTENWLVVRLLSCEAICGLQICWCPVDYPQYTDATRQNSCLKNYSKENPANVVVPV